MIALIIVMTFGFAISGVVFSALGYIIGFVLGAAYFLLLFLYQLSVIIINLLRKQISQRRNFNKVL